MAKKKQAETETVDEQLATLRKQILDQFGDDIIIDGEELAKYKRMVIPLSPISDFNLGGGVPEGSWVLCSGPEKCGKTTTALSFASTCQQKQYGGRQVFFHDVEWRLKEMNFNGVKGLNMDKFQIIRSTEKDVLTAEKHLDIATKILNTYPGCLLIIDSASALCSEKEFIDDATGQARSLGPKLMSNFCKKLANVIGPKRCIVWIMQHLIANTGGGPGPKYMEDGGRKLQYQADIKIRATHTEDWNIGSGDNQTKIGQVIHWKMFTAALAGNIPGSKYDSYLRYGIGIDMLQEEIILGCNLGIVAKSGSWLTFGEHKVQGMEKLYQLLDDDDSKRKELQEAITAMLKS